MFARKETPTIMDGLVIRWQLGGGGPFTGEISASRNGVLICGTWPTFRDPEALVEIKAILDEAYREHHRMAAQARQRPWGRL